MSKVFKRTYTDKKGKRCRTRKYYGSYTDADGIRRIMDGCKYRFIRDISASCVQSFLTDLKRQVYPHFLMASAPSSMACNIVQPRQRINQLGG